jgi:aspartate aminotransferase
MIQQYSKFISNLHKKINDPNFINLAIGQPDFKPSKEMVNALKENIGINTGYTDIDGLPELRALIKKKLQYDNKIKTEKIIVTNGAIEAIFDSMLTHIKTDSEIILFSPYYIKYTTAPNIVKAKIKTISMKNKRPDLESLEHNINKKTKMIVVNSPCNPTGIVFTGDEIKHLIEIVEKYDLILLSDEVYEKFLYDAKKHISPGRYSNRVITINSFSKTYGFPGLRLGYLAGSLELINPIMNTHMSNTTCSPYMSQMAAIAAIKSNHNPFDLSTFDKRRKLVMKNFNEIGIDYIYPEGSFYIYFYVNKDSIRLAGEMMDNNLLLMPSKLFGDKNNAFRLSYAVDDMILKKGLEILTTLLG